MRVTQRILQDHWLQDVQSRLQSVDETNQQIGSGKRVEKPSDDPAGAGRIVRLEEAVARNDQYLKNIEEVLSVQKTSESVLEQVSQNLVRAKSLAVEGASDSETSYSSLAEEVAGIKAGVLTLLRTQYEGKFLFAGTADDRAPFEEGDGVYRGNSESLRVNIGNGQSTAVNVPGDRAFREPSARGTRSIVDDAGQVVLGSDVSFQVSDGTVTVNVSLPAASSPYQPQDFVQAINDQLGPSGANLEARMDAEGRLEIAIADSQRGGEITIEGADAESALGLTTGTKNLFGLLSDLEAALGSSDPADAVGKLLDRMDRAMDSVLAQRGDLGARTRSLEFTKDRLTTYNVTSQALQEQIEGVDLPAAVTKLSAEQQAYQTALAAGARILNVSLLDFLR